MHDDWDDDDMNGLDWKAIARVGVPSVIALFLVWRLSEQYGMFEKRLESLQSQHSQMAVDSAATSQALDRIDGINQSILFVLRTSCIQAAKTQVERRECLQDGR